MQKPQVIEKLKKRQPIKNNNINIHVMIVCDFRIVSQLQWFHAIFGGASPTFAA